MILIFSTANDPSTLDVIRWIHHLGGAKVVRINADDTYRVDLTFADDDYQVRVDEECFRLADVSSAWLRKGDFWFRGLFPAVEVPRSQILTDYLNKKLQQEDRRLREHFHHVLKQRCAVLGSANGSIPNKLVVLELARELGLRTPPFRITTSRHYTQALVESGASYVSKAMSDGLYLFDVQETKAGYFTYTEPLEPSSVERVGERIVPSFFQRYVEKAFELRVFFLGDTFRTVAIFSQNDEQTRIDYRKYNLARPNRMIPYQLSREVEAQLSRLADRLGLNTGSIDLIADKRGEIYFLEVNPVGQFGQLSDVCNLSIERLIAERLLAHEQ